MSAKGSALSGVAVVPMIPEVSLRRILFATDFSPASEKALPVVSAIARKYGSHVFVAHVWTPLPYSMTTPEAVTVLEARQEREAREETTNLLQRKELEGLPCSVLVKGGSPGEELSCIVRTYNIDLAIVGTHGRSGVKRFVTGSVAEELWRNLSCPVLTVGPHTSERLPGPVAIRKILFPTDLSEESKTVFPYVASLASEYNAEVIFLHVLPTETSTNPMARKLAEPLRKTMERTFSAGLSPRCKAEYLIDFGGPSERILTYATKHNVDLIGMGIRRAPDFTTHLWSTVAYKVVVQAECPVLTCRSGAKE